MMRTIADPYDRQARLYPGLLVVLPLTLAVVPFFGTNFKIFGSLGVVLGSAGVAYWLAQVARDPGKKLEERLWQSWGGSPTIRRLRHRSASNPITLGRLHRRLETLVDGIGSLPSKEEEERSPEQADLLYEECVRVLRARTRDHVEFPLVFKELCGYGFRRNMLGLRPWGVATSVTGASIILFSFVLHPMSALSLLILFAQVALVTAWLFVVSDVWVRIPAEAYAKALIETIEQLSVASQAH